MERILATDSKFVDKEGKTYFFHGINIVDKGQTDKFLNYKKKDLWCKREYQLQQLTYEELVALKSMGVNIIRLGITWEAIEPEMEKYDEEIISKLHSSVKKCESLNIRVVLDIHQDLYAGFGNSWGDGAPKWATLTDDIEYKYPRLVWAMGYFTGDATARAFDNFWSNKEIEGIGIQDRFGLMWQHLAESFSDCSNIFGYDFFNEPFAGTYGRKLLKVLIKQAKHVVFHDKAFKWSNFFKGLLPKMHKTLFDTLSPEVLDKVIDPCHEIMIEFDKKFYNPFLAKVTSYIRKVDKEGMVLVDNNYFSNIGVKPGVEPIKINNKKDKNQCFSPHAYDFMIDTPMYNYASNERIKYLFDKHSETAKELNLPVLVGEWGGYCLKGVEWLKHIEYLLNYFDEKGWSRIYWQYRNLIYLEHSSYIFMRPYVTEINGSLLSSSYDYKTNELNLKVRLDDKENNLKIFSPTIVIQSSEEYKNIEKFNSKEDIINVEKYFNSEMVKIAKVKKWQKWIDKSTIDLDVTQFNESCFINYSLKKGEYDINIKITKPTNQLDNLKQVKIANKQHRKTLKQMRKNIK